MENKCKCCSKTIIKKSYGRFLDSIMGFEKNPLCIKCFMSKRTDFDRTGRHSKKDKAKSKYIREKIY